MNKVIDFKENIEEEILNNCGNCLKSGGVIVFPTETVYGIGANAYDSEAVLKIFKAKNRPADNPLIVHICDFEMLKEVVDIDKLNIIEKKLINEFFPGPLTIILPKNKKISNLVTAGFDTVGVRMPDNEIANRLIKAAGVPIAAPSANVSGRPSGTRVEDIQAELIDKVDYIIDGGSSNIGIESTVIKVKAGRVNILRPGKVTKEDIEKIVGKGNVILNSKIFEEVNENEKVESPGMKHRHYAPSSKCILLYSDNFEKLYSKIINLIKTNNMKYNKIGIACFSEHIETIKKINSNIEVLDLGSINDIEQISRNLFNNLRQIDKKNIDFCIIEGVKKQGIGIGIMNRLLRACEYNYTEL